MLKNGFSSTGNENPKSIRNDEGDIFFLKNIKSQSSFDFQETEEVKMDR